MDRVLAGVPGLDRTRCPIRGPADSGSLFIVDDMQFAWLGLGTGVNSLPVTYQQLPLVGRFIIVGGEEMVVRASLLRGLRPLASLFYVGSLLS